MNTPQHTPGPWTYDAAWGTVMAAGPVKVKICDPPCQNLRGADGTQTPAESAFYAGNARLIAAAPELLAALTELVTLCEMNETDPDAHTRENCGGAKHCALCAARDTIAKANGDGA